jgi:hypothetical protein
MRADKAALGVLPVMGYRHCEPLRTASAFGWYIFPPERILLRFNGADVFYCGEGIWKPLTQAFLPGFEAYWDKNAPKELKGLAPPFLSRIPVGGIVQIWSGLLCSTKADWSVLVRPLANVGASHLFSCFEGVIESDRHKPFPLFINIQLKATDVEIELLKTAPLFQVQPLLRDCYGEVGHSFSEHVGLEPAADGTAAMSDLDWQAFRKTIRIEMPDQAPEPGQYTVATRRRAKHE